VDRVSREASRLAATLATLLLAGCDFVERPPGINCEKLRALQIGMSRNEVRTLLGPPRWEAPEHPNYKVPSWDYRFDYSNRDSGNDGVRLVVDFMDDRLVAVDSYVRTTWRELTGQYSGGKPDLFWMYEDKRREGNEFERIFCPHRR
jgi:hypothetical protein